jgi:hypothetical protein
MLIEKVLLYFPLLKPLLDDADSSYQYKTKIDDYLL